MDRSQSLLFGSYPRSVGVTTPERRHQELRQYIVHSKTEMDGVAEKVSGQRNLYVSVSSYRQYRKNGSIEGYSIVSDKVSFDFDSSAKAPADMDYRWNHPCIPQDAGDEWVADRLRTSESVREAVLGDVCEDVRRMADASLTSEIPVVGVFSGFGLHLYQLYEETEHRVEQKLSSNSRRWISELSLSTVDEKASGKPFRILRYPNIERIIHDAERSHSGIYTVPLSGPELADITPEELVQLSTSPRNLESSAIDSRPTMKIHEEHVGPGADENIGQEKMLSVPDEEIGSDFAKMLVKDVVKMPCVWKRALSRSPDHNVRVKLGIMFLNAGYTPSETADIFAQIGWHDFDRDTTRYQLQQIKKSGKGDYSCSTMMKKGLCVHADEPDECPTFGYRGGNKP